MEEINKHRLISRQDAAAMVGTDVQTISNWLASGLIRGRKMGCRQYVDRTTIESLLDDARQVEEARVKLQELRGQYEEESIKLERELKEVIRLKGMIACSPAFASTVAFQILNVFIDEGVFSAREEDILLAAMNGESTRIIASRYNLSEERVRQIIVKGARKLVAAATDVRLLRYPALKKELKDAHDKMERMEAETARLKEQLAAYNVEAKEETPEEARLRDVLHQDLADYYPRYLSTRTMNGLHTIDIRTVADLVGYSRGVLLRIRQFGRRSLTECDDLLEMLGRLYNVELFYGMPIPRLSQGRTNTSLAYAVK